MTTVIADPIDVKELENVVRESIKADIKVWARNTIYASQLSDECLRRQEYYLTRGNDQAPISPELQEIFNEGKLHEPAIAKKLEAAGFKLRQNQKPLVENVKRGDHTWRYKVSGRLDFEMTHPVLLGGKWYPVEAKSMSPYTWDSVDPSKHGLDMLKHKREYMRRYPMQLMYYLYSSGAESGLLVLKNKLTGRLKFVWVHLDYEMMESLLQKAEDINIAVERIEKDPVNAESHLSPRIFYDEKICGECAFNHICLPDETFGGVELDVSGDTEELLRRHEELKPFKQQYDRVHDEVKEAFEKRPPKLYLIGGSFNVKVENKHRSAYKVDESDYVQVTVKQLKRQEEEKKTPKEHGAASEKLT